MRVDSATWCASRPSGFCEMSVLIYQTTRSHKSDNLKSHQWRIQVRICVGPCWTQSYVVNFRTLRTSTHTQTHQWSNLGIWVFHGSKHTYLQCCLHVVTLCSVYLFPEDGSGRSSKTMVTANDTVHNIGNYTLKVKVWFRLNHLYKIAALHIVTLLYNIRNCFLIVQSISWFKVTHISFAIIVRFVAKMVNVKLQNK
jgi:hypothetical protein